MAVTILRYPGGLEYPEFWRNNVQGLTPTGSYTLSFDQALSKFPGLEYDAQFNSLKNSPSTSTTPTNTQSAPSSYMDIQVAGPATSEPQFNDDQFYQYEQDLDTYNKTIEADKQKQVELDKAVEDKRAIYLSGLKDFAAIRAALGEVQNAIRASSNFYSSTIGKYQRPTAPKNYKPTGRPLPTPVQATSPETQKNFEIVQQQAATGNVDSKQFLDAYVGKEDNLIAQNLPGPTSTPSDKLRGQSTPVMYDEKMKMMVPVVPAGNVINTLLRQASGPRGETLRDIASIFPPAMTLQELQRDIRSRGNAVPGTKEYGELRDLQKEWIQRQKLKGAEAPETGPRGEALIAQALPVGPRGMDRAPGTYHPSNIMPLITPGAKFSDKEGYMIQDPFRNSPKTGPGLSEQREDFDPYKAQVASAAAKEYRRQAQTEDPFRSGAFG